MKNLFLIILTLLNFNSRADGLSDTQVSTILTVAPFYLTTDAVEDALTKNEYEEAGDIAADGVVTDEEREEMSVELQARLDECLETFGQDFGYDEIQCLKEIARYDD